MGCWWSCARKSVSSFELAVGSFYNGNFSIKINLVKYTCFFVFVCLLTVNGGCIHHEHKDVELAAWSSLTIVSEEDTQITINNDGDTSMVNVYHRGSFFAPLPKNTKVKVNTFKVYFTKAEKDTLFSLVKDLIEHPAKTSNFCTEYVGSLGLMIVYGEQFKQRGEYSSVCDWTILSDKTKHLHDVLRRRIKSIYLGEGEAATSHVSN